MSFKQKLSTKWQTLICSSIFVLPTPIFLSMWRKNFRCSFHGSSFIAPVPAKRCRLQKLTLEREHFYYFNFKYIFAFIILTNTLLELGFIIHRKTITCDLLALLVMIFGQPYKSGAHIETKPIKSFTITFKGFIT